MLNLSVVFICVVIMDNFVFYLWYLLVMFNNMVLFTVRIMNGVGKGSFIPSHTHMHFHDIKTLYPSFVPLRGIVGYALVR